MSDEMNALQLACFDIISNVGMARSCYIEAIDLAEADDIDQAHAKMSEGDQYFSAGHAKHGELIQQEATGDHVPVDILLVHAEDQLMSAETFKILAEKFIKLAEK